MACNGKTSTCEQQKGWLMLAISQLNYFLQLQIKLILFLYITHISNFLILSYLIWIMKTKRTFLLCEYGDKRVVTHSN